MAFSFLRSLIRSSGRIAAPAEPMFDGLETRLALYADPFLAAFPSLSDMKNINDTVVRVQTTAGIIDIEVYDRGGPPAPVTAANFLNYIKTGRYENSFFHRLVTGFVLQGGGFVYDTTVTPASSTVVTDPPIVNEFSLLRSNVERTVAMAKLSDLPDSATSQFFFNLGDNSGNLNNQNGGFTVFGQVIGGWNVVTTIAGFQTRNLNTFLGGNAFDSVPVSGNSNTDLVKILDIEVVKPAGQTEFYSKSLYFPDGFRSGRIVSTIELVNNDPNAATLYQIVARFETGTRDTVIASGTLAAGAHLEIPVSKGGTPSINNVRAGAPFGYEIKSNKNVSATLNHTDFGATAAEAFFQAEPFTASQIQEWSFGGAQKGPGIAGFLTYVNLSGVDNVVTVTFYPDTGSPFTLTKTVQAHRRGGLDVSQISGVPVGVYSVRITSTQPLVAALSQYRAAPARATLELGVMGGGNTEGILPGAYIASGGLAFLNALYTGSTPGVTIDFQFILGDGSIFNNNAPFTLSTTTRRQTRDLSTFNGAIPRNEYFTIRYKVRDAVAPVTVSFFSIVNGDAIGTSFQTVSSKELVFADGFTDPTANAEGRETLSIFNPYADSNTAVTYQVRFHFADSADDEIITLPASLISASRRTDINVRDLTQVMARINSDTKFRHYSISVSATFQRSGGEVEGAIFAQLTRLDPAGNTVAYGPTLAAGIPLFFADNAAFGAP